MLSAVLL